MNETRYMPIEYRADDDSLGTVTGTVMRYGDVATLPWGTESFEPGAFEFAGRGLRVNRMHVRQQPLAVQGGTLELEDTEEMMTARFKLPDTTAGRDADYELRNGLLTGLSVEFRTLKDLVEKAHRRVQRATLFGFGLVDVPAYPDSKAQMRWDEYRGEHGLEMPTAVEADPEPEIVTPARRYFLPLV